MDSTIDPILGQVINHIDENLAKKVEHFSKAISVDRTFAILHALESVDLAQRERINDVDKEHWLPSTLAFALMEIGNLGVRHRTLPYLRIVAEPANWLVNKQPLLQLCKDNVEPLWFQSSLRSVGTLLISVAHKQLSLLGPEEDGGILFRITKNGERAGIGKAGYAFHYSLTASKNKSNPTYDEIKSWLKTRRSGRLQ